MLTTMAVGGVVADKRAVLSHAAVERIEVRMVKLKMNRVELAVKCGLSKSTISRTLNRENGPTLDTLERLSDALGMSISEITGDSEFHVRRAPDVPHSDADELEVLRIIQQQLDYLRRRLQERRDNPS